MKEPEAYLDKIQLGSCEYTTEDEFAVIIDELADIMSDMLFDQEEPIVAQLPGEVEEDFEEEEDYDEDYEEEDYDDDDDEYWTEPSFHRHWRGRFRGRRYWGRFNHP